MQDKPLASIKFMVPVDKKNAYVHAARAQDKKLLHWIQDALDKQVAAQQTPSLRGATEHDKKMMDFVAWLMVEATSNIYSHNDDERFFKSGFVESVPVRFRLLVERAIVRKLVQDILEAYGDTRYAVTVYDGEEDALSYSRDFDAIMDAICSTDQDVLRVYPIQADGSYGRCCMSVVLVYGNDGFDVIADHSTNAITERLIAGASALADGIAEIVTKKGT